MFQTTNQLFNHTLPFLCVYCWHMLSSVVFICFLQPSPLPTRIFLAHGCYTGLPTLVKCCTFSTDETSCFNTARKKKKNTSCLPSTSCIISHPSTSVHNVPPYRTDVCFIHHHPPQHHHPTPDVFRAPLGRRKVSSCSRAAWSSVASGEWISRGC